MAIGHERLQGVDDSRSADCIYSYDDIASVKRL